VNLAILIGHFPPGAFGGAELQAEAWARRLAARHRVTVVTRRVSGLPPAERRDGYEIVRLSVSRVPLLRTAVDLQRIARAVGVIEPRPDLMLCFQTFVSGLAGVRAQRRLGVPAAVWVRSEVEYDLRSPRMRMIGPAVWGAARGVLVHSEGHRAAMLDALARGAPGMRYAVAAKLEVIPNGVDLPPPAVGRRGDCVLTVAG
jgi:glycosyltransferase involved in cell wall biosynthesis